MLLMLCLFVCCCGCCVCFQKRTCFFDLINLIKSTLCYNFCCTVHVSYHKHKSDPFLFLNNDIFSHLVSTCTAYSHNWQWSVDEGFTGPVCNDPDVINLQTCPLFLVLNQNRKRGQVCRLMTSGTLPPQYGPHRLIIANYEKSLYFE